MRAKTNKYFGDNKITILATVLLLSGFAFSIIEAFDNVLYTDWFRQNIHLFTPIIPALLLAYGRLRRESLVLFFLGIVLIIAHYFFLHVLISIGKAGAAVFKLL